MNSIVIRQAITEDEIREVFSIRKEVFVTEQGMFQGSDVDENDSNSIYLIAQSNGTIVGTVRAFPVDGNSWIGGRLAVRKNFRGSRAGFFLVQEAVKLVKSKKGRRFSANIQEKNINFFKKLGWIPVGNVFDHMGYPHQIMEVDLNA